jgi:hypothetical protein
VFIRNETKIENNKYDPTLGLAMRLARRLDTTVEEQPENETGTFTPGGVEKDNSIPAEETPADDAMNPPETGAEEKPRRKRKARE